MPINMARKKSHPTIKSSHHGGSFLGSMPRPALQMYDNFHNWLILNVQVCCDSGVVKRRRRLSLHTFRISQFLIWHQNKLSYPGYKKYKRLTSTPLGRIARDVVVVFTFVMIMIRWQTSPKYQYWYRNIVTTGDLQYSRYVFNVSVTTNTYRSIIGEIESTSVRHSSEAVLLLASGQKGCDSLGVAWIRNFVFLLFFWLIFLVLVWNETGILHKIFKTGYRAIALDPPGQGISTVGYVEPSFRVSQRDMGSYLKNVVKLLGVDKLVMRCCESGFVT